MMSKILYGIITISSGLLIIGSLFLGYVAIYPFNVMQVNSPLKIISPVVRQGDCVFTEMEYDQKVNTPSLLTMQVLIDDNIVIASYLLSWNIDQGKHRLVAGFTLPRNINIISNKKTVDAKLKVTAEYTMMGFRRVHSVFYTDKFKIILVE